MIRINLLPVRQSAAQKKFVLEAALLAAALGLMIVLAFVAVVVFAARVSDREDTYAKNAAQIKTYQETIGEVEKVEKQKERLESQLQEIERLKRGKLGPVRVLDAMSNNIPQRVWISSFVEKDGKVEIKGTGLENADISEFLRQLEKSIYFTNVNLNFTESTKQNGVLIYNFSITADVNYTA